METPEEQRATTLLNIIIDLTQRLNQATEESEKYKRWWLSQCNDNAEIREKLEKAANSENL